jgi:hypothetical protein
MKKQLILSTILLLLFISCENKKKQEPKEENADTFLAFNWTKPNVLKQKTLSKLKEKVESTDKIIMNFLLEYTKIEEEFNEILYEQNNFDSLNSLISQDESQILQYAIDFEQKVNANGFSITSSEGMIYLVKNTDFIKAEIVELIDPVASEFLNLYCNKIDMKCCEDAGIIISKQELISRIYNWGEFIDKSTDLAYEKYAENVFNTYLNLAYTGLDNTPAFDWDTEIFNTELADLMNDIITQNPNSKAAKDFKPFINILTRENFVKTQKVDDFLQLKFEL